MLIFWIAAAVLLLLAACLYAGFLYTCKRNPDPDWNSQEALDKTIYKNFPVSIPDCAQWLRDHNAQDVQVTSFDGLTLRGKWVPAEKPIATIILVHGYRSNYLVDFGGIFHVYHNLGLNLLLIRQRAHGESEGKYITFGVRERLDVLKWIEFHNREHGMDNLYLGGMSMGASTVLFAAGEELPENLRGITADCGFTSPYDIIGKVMRQQFRLPPKPILPLINIFTRKLAGFDLRECTTTETLKRSKVPILFIHGTGDDYVPYQMSQAGFDACVSPKQIVLSEGAGHGMSYLKEKKNLTRILTAFFTDNLSTQFQLEETP